MTGMAGCCAPAGNAHTTAPPNTVMKSRRLMRSASWRGDDLRTEGSDPNHHRVVTLEWSCGPQRHGGSIAVIACVTKPMEPLMPVPSERGTTSGGQEAWTETSKHRVSLGRRGQGVHV